MRFLYVLHLSLSVAIPAIQPRLRLSGTNHLRSAFRGGQRGYVATSVVLLKHGTDSAGWDKNGSTALILATDSGHNDIVKALSDHYADVNAQDNDGATALIWAVGQDKADTAQILIAAGADVTLADVDGITPLMEAARKGSEQMVKLLLQHGADKTH
ncbi:MAG: ankyrin repeat domain-containing protein [Candidatus Thiodiazotropha sp. (ex Lucinoma aequizonata)]|nr:ankyrin repeat domain-containing protein [Candidatus Thiodiazotropha sp. (ex Lucinoma aequizonata)]MCU7889215.1 ankyrin repeat domain-containing protein [Candidatus Thiodiazotropha sp. (ex Lucinoma aequizonata)]MCU7894054.1 ankyrin repeat domain-containing protein [Candidatus Thiodiazotropha sp. (ex Lucinoma aequizonata)]MCU7899711.1 ankyrin repeat domain-containing protein [Candidatus Thiodiazotropha sp. (ex Lucinoma aequizonata)]MCU7902803.1 ankyrin repeat domain-containing protein [Candid